MHLPVLRLRWQNLWLRDYLYKPLGGSRGGEPKTYRNLMVTMLLGGLWHGAAWTFALWGGSMVPILYYVAGGSNGAALKSLTILRTRVWRTVT